jgi:uncharacterized protein
MHDIEEPSLESLRAATRRLPFYLMHMEPIPGLGPVDEARRAEVLREHLLYQRDLEASGQLFLAGPVDPENTPGLGLSVLRCRDLDEARAIAEAEPFHVAGLRRNRVQPWLVNEGSISLRVDLFADTVTVL